MPALLEAEEVRRRHFAALEGDVHPGGSLRAEDDDQEESDDDADSGDDRDDDLDLPAEPVAPLEQIDDFDEDDFDDDFDDDFEEDLDEEEDFSSDPVEGDFDDA